MPAIRDEEWFYSPTFKEGEEALKEGKKDVRFCGLLLGQDKLQDDEMDSIIDMMRNTKTKSLSIDWFDVEPKSFEKIKQLADDDFTFELDAFHLTMIDLSQPKLLSAVSSLVYNNKHIVDLILTFCSINCDNVGILGQALENNQTILSLNLNFNLLKKAGYLTLADSLIKNNTLRYLEAKLNKAEKADLVEFTKKLSVADTGNTTLEYIDLGQEDDIDGKIEQNKIPEKTTKKVANKGKKVVEKTITTKDAANLNANADVGVPPAPPANGADANDNGTAPQDEDLFALVKDYLTINKQSRLDTEKELKIGQLKDILTKETQTIRASLKHCKIMMLGDKNVGKTFFAHCLVHQLYLKNDTDTEGTRKLDTLSLSRVTELGWTKISSFHHVDMILAKRISTLPINMRNRNKANEVCFQFPEQVIISAKDLQASGSMLDKEDQLLLKKLDIKDEDNKVEEETKQIFNEEEKTQIEGRFTEKMSDIIDKALRENNYPSFSIWDVDSPPGFSEIFRFFYNNHGMIYIFFSIVDIKNDKEKVINSVLKYLRPIKVAKTNNQDFTSKVFLIGTFLDQVINDGIDDNVSTWVDTYATYEKEKALESSGENGHINFILEKLEKDEDKKVVESIKQMLQAFNVDLMERIQAEFNDYIVPNDGDDLLFFPLSNNLPDMCKNFKSDFDDISGINKFRSKVRSLIDGGDIKVIEVMKSLKDAKIIDLLMEKKRHKPENESDHRGHYLKLEDFEDIAAKAGITSRAQVAILLRYLDVTGIVSWISDSQTLQKLVVLDPDYVIDGLKNFYTSLTTSDQSEQFIAQLEKDATLQGLAADVKNLRLRVVSHDLLLEKLLSRDNFEYFKDFLLRCSHLNTINTKVLGSLFSKQNLCDTFSDDDDLYLVPSFEDKLIGGVGNTLFLKHKAKFVPSNGIFLRGAFERALTSLIDSFNNAAMEEQVKDTKNELDYSENMAVFQFGEEKFSIAHLVGNEDKEVGGFLQFEFSEGAAKMFLDFIERVMRNGDFLWDGYVLENKEWIPIHEAKKQLLAPYFFKKENTFSAEGLEDAFDLI